MSADEHGFPRTRRSYRPDLYTGECSCAARTNLSSEPRTITPTRIPVDFPRLFFHLRARKKKTGRGRGATFSKTKFRRSGGRTRYSTARTRAGACLQQGDRIKNGTIVTPLKTTPCQAHLFFGVLKSSISNVSTFIFNIKNLYR